MRFSDSTNYNIPKPIKYANSDSSPFNSDDSLSDDNSSQDNLTSPTPSNYNTDFPSQHNSLTKMNDKNTKFLHHTKPQNYLFIGYKYTSPYTMTNLYTIDHSRITG